ncbi:fibroblast growth factor receptor 4-like isoform X1 [Branchiostoma floridae]|uniref:receptor protein-tyrosine kinase n=2 Tax=Branchiostoma floridae TaxID=7739 RepID=A0A9J7KSQ2_BRAFL|nr:fibroblast growth factor receptor 4-like isoform X1 [Branchiostoma floridae]
MDFLNSWFRTGFLHRTGLRRLPRLSQMNWTGTLFLLATLWTLGSTQEPLSSTTVVLVGYPAVLSCGYASEQPPASVDWYRLEGLDADQERTHLLYHDSNSGTFAFGNYSDRATVVDDANLRLDTVYMSDNGDYECEVPTTEDYDTFLSKVRLQVLESPDGPRITGYSPPLLAGQTLHLRCESQIVGDVRPTLVWYNGSQELSRVEPSVWQPDTTTAVLNYVLDVSKYDNAKPYRCQAMYRGPVGVREQKVTLDIRYAPTTHMTYPLGTQVREGDDVLLRCGVDSNPPSTVSWERLEGAMPPNHKLYEEHHLLRIVGITRQFHGTYQCKAENSLGISTTSVRLDILYAPSIARQVWNTAEALVGENFTRTCVADGNPTPSVRWSRDGSEEVYDDPLFFSSINFTDDGSYICRARSSIPNFPDSTAKFRLDVKGPPQIVKQNTIFSAKENGSVTLECEVESDPPATRVAWKWESNSIESGTVGRYSVRQKETPTSILSTLTIKSVQASDFRSYQCLAVNVHGEETQVIVLERATAPPPQPIPLVAIVLPVILVFFMVVLGLLYYLRKYWQRKLPWTPKYLKNKDMEMRAIEDDYLPPIAQDSASPMPLLPGDDPSNYYQEPDLIRDLEFPRDKLSLERVLGRGNFGQVIKAKAQGVGGADKPMTVAVKTTKDGSSADAKEDLLKELKMMKLIPPHPNVVMLIGYCTKTEPVYVIVEYCALGNLQNFLRKCRSKRDSTYANIQVDERLLTPRDLASFIWQIARGMAHVASLKIVHRDLASRNVLIDKNKVCKISDFGLSRDVYDTDNEEYEQKTQGRLPLRWMAPESLFDHVYSVKSDVWSFGITMWEVLTLACTPYPGLSPPAMMERLRNGFRMSKPVHCNDEVYDIMRKCWEDDPEDRPTFIDLVRLLEDVITKAEDFIKIDEIPAAMYDESNSKKSKQEKC